MPMRLLSFLLLALLAPTVRAQPGAPSAAPDSVAPRSLTPAGVPLRTFSVWRAGASDQALATRLGWRHERGLTMLGIEGGWLMRSNASGSRTLYYLAGVMPLATATGMPRYYTTSKTTCTKASCEKVTTTHMEPHTVRAFGIMPLGFASSFRVNDRFAVRGRATAGLLSFSEAIPDPLARRLNFSGDIGATLDARVTDRMTVTAGMRINHISNGYTGEVNPGMNSFMPEIGITIAP